jgi:GT2 family glycosyltransferase
MKTLTVIVLNWNGLADTRACLASLARCETPSGWNVRILVVDNGSTDGSAAALRAEFPANELLALPENRRFAGGNNEGLRVALTRGDDAVMLLNNDTEADPRLFVELVGALEHDASAGAAAPLILFGAPSTRIWYAGGRLIPALAHASHRGLREQERGQWRQTEPTGYLTGCCLLAWSSAWKRVGLLDERYFIYAEDADWCLRARQAGLRLLFVPAARLRHKVSASTGAASPFKIYHRLRANASMFARHARSIARLTWAPAFLAQQGALFAWLLVRGQAPAALAVPRALWDAVRGVPAGEARL